MKPNPAALRTLGAVALTLGTNPASAQVQRGFIEVVGGDSLYIEITGSGAPVVLLHDGTLHSIVWDHQVPVLSERFQVVRYDRRGYGRSSKPDTSYSNADDLTAVLDSLGIDQVVLVGSSAGGRLASEYAIANPGRVVGLVLIGAMVSGLPRSEQFIEYGWWLVDPILTSGRRAVLNPIPETALEEMARRYGASPYLISEENPAVRERMRRLVREHFENILNPARWIEWLEPSARERLSEITVPTLIIVGEDDHPDVHASAGAFRIGIAESTRVLLPDAAHLPQLERPEAVNRLLIQFLETQVTWGRAGAANGR